jgi:hypothetical protein
MHKLKNIILLLTALFFVSNVLLAQSSAQSSANVKIQVKKGLSITNLDGDLNFGEVILTGNPQVETITPDNGVNFEIIGHPSKSVMITYTADLLSGGGSTDLTFSPDFKHTAENTSYSSPLDVVSGNSYALGAAGKLYLWLGGSVDVEAAEEIDYTGAFNVTVAY